MAFMPYLVCVQLQRMWTLLKVRGHRDIPGSVVGTLGQEKSKVGIMEEGGDGCFHSCQHSARLKSLKKKKNGQGQSLKATWSHEVMESRDKCFFRFCFPKSFLMVAKGLWDSPRMNLLFVGSTQTEVVITSVSEHLNAVYGRRRARPKACIICRLSGASLGSVTVDGQERRLLTSC